MLKTIFTAIFDLVPTTVAVIGTLIAIYLAHRFLEGRQKANDGYRFGNQMILLLLTVIGVLIVIVTLPIPGDLRGQLLSFLGIVLSAAVALSSTTILGNALASLMLQAIRGFRIGDFIRVGDQFGRVSERGLFHTEIQTEDRELTTFSNLHLVTNPVTTIRSSGTIISATVSLGYDIPHTRVEELLTKAAKEIGLEDPFVQVQQLGDFSVSYRVAGLLRDVSKLISTRSRLRAAAMDSLHRGGVEIVSPNFMNQRVFPETRQFAPKTISQKSSADDSADPEKTIFDKAAHAEETEQLKLRVVEVKAEIDQLRGELKEAADDKGKARIQKRIDQHTNELTNLQEQIKQRQEKKSE